MNYEVYDEPQGYRCEFGYVKSNPLNNKAYIENVISAVPKWAGILREADKAIEAVSPGYNIVQIKVKFGSVRFYIGTATGRLEANKIAQEAEAAMTLALKP